MLTYSGGETKRHAQINTHKHRESTYRGGTPSPISHLSNGWHRWARQHLVQPGHLQCIVELGYISWCVPWFGILHTHMHLKLLFSVSSWTPSSVLHRAAGSSVFSRQPKGDCGWFVWGYTSLVTSSSRLVSLFLRWKLRILFVLEALFQGWLNFWEAMLLRCSAICIVKPPASFC